MHHGHHMGHGIGAAFGGGGGGGGLAALLPLLLIGTVLLVGAAVAIYWLWRRRPSPSEAERRDAATRENVHGQVLAMLAQAGGSLDQLQIRDNLGLSVQEVGEALHQLEAEGRITRIWRPEGFTYLVRAVN